MKTEITVPASAVLEALIGDLKAQQGELKRMMAMLTTSMLGLEHQIAFVKQQLKPKKVKGASSK